MATFREAPEVQRVAERLIPERHPHLENARIGYLFREGPWRSKGKAVLARALKVSDREAFFTGLHFVLLVNALLWVQLEPYQQEALVDHELSHMWRDEGNWAIRGHDVEEFTGVIQRHGLWSKDVAELVGAAQEYQQVRLFEEEPEEARQLA